MGAIETVLLPSYYRFLLEQRSTQQLLSSHIALLNSFGLIAALVLTMCFETTDTWETSRTAANFSADDTIWGEESSLAQDIWSLSMALTFSASIFLLFTCIIGIIYASPVPEHSGGMFIKSLGFFHYIMYTVLLVFVMALSFIAAIIVSYSCCLRKNLFIVFMVATVIILAPFMWFTFNTAPKATKKAVHHHNLWVKYYDVNGDGIVTPDEVRQVEQQRANGKDSDIGFINPSYRNS